MGGVQAAVIAEHGFLVVKQPAEQLPVGIIPKGNVGEQVNHRGYCHEEHKAEQDGTPCIRDKMRPDISVGDTVRTAGRVCAGINVFPISFIQYREENYRQAAAGIYAGPFAGDTHAHAEAAGAQGQQCPLQACVIEA